MEAPSFELQALALSADGFMTLLGAHKGQTMKGGTRLPSVGLRGPAVRGFEAHRS
jgi:hypothetical protein